MSGAIHLHRLNASLHTQREIYLYLVWTVNKLARQKCSATRSSTNLLQVLNSQTRIICESVWRSGAMFGFWPADSVDTVWALHSCPAALLFAPLCYVLRDYCNWTATLERSGNFRSSFGLRLQISPHCPFGSSHTETLFSTDMTDWLAGWMTDWMTNWWTKWLIT